MEKNYKTEEFKNINLKQKRFFRGFIKPWSRAFKNLWQKVAKADGKVGGAWSWDYKTYIYRYFNSFSKLTRSSRKSKKLYDQEKDSFANLMTICEKII